jgi:hypothetical protein
MIGLTFAAWVGTGSVAHAYIDPGSGALIWQLLLAGVFGVLFYARGTIRRIRDRLGVGKKRVHDDSVRGHE